MPKVISDDDQRFKVAVRKKISNVNVTIPDVMRIAKYTDEEIEDYALQQRIRRAAAKASDEKKTANISLDASVTSTISTIKSSVATTLITGSTAAGEAIPPHFQFATAAQSIES